MYLFIVTDTSFCQNQIAFLSTILHNKLPENIKNTFEHATEKLIEYFKKNVTIGEGSL